MATYSIYETFSGMQVDEFDTLAQCQQVFDKSYASSTIEHDVPDYYIQETLQSTDSTII